MKARSVGCQAEAKKARARQPTVPAQPSSKIRRAEEKIVRNIVPVNFRTAGTVPGLRRGCKGAARGSGIAAEMRRV